MKNSKELAYYTGGNSGAMQEWYNREYKHAQNVLNTWLKDYRISSKKDNELVRDIAAYDLEGDVIFQNYIRALLKCREEYTMDTVILYFRRWRKNYRSICADGIHACKPIMSSCVPTNQENA